MDEDVTISVAIGVAAVQSEKLTVGAEVIDQVIFAAATVDKGTVNLREETIMETVDKVEVATLVVGAA